jgi:dethiobiotin synthetase
MVPINANDCLPSFIQTLGLACVVVASTQLGTINHTLLTLAALETMNIPTLGVLMVGTEDPSATTGIRNHSSVPILAHLPKLRRVAPSSVGECIPIIQRINPIMQTLEGKTHEIAIR